MPAIDPLPYVDAARRAMGEELPERSGPQVEEPEKKTNGTDACVCPPETVAGENARGKPEATPAHQGPCQPPSAPCPASQEEAVHAGKPACETGEDAPEEPDFPFVPAPKAPPADRLRPLLWPRGFEALRPYFERGIPCRLFDLPGWRFVNAAQAGGPDGLWVGIQQVDGACGAWRTRTAPKRRRRRPSLPPGQGHGRPYLSGAVAAGMSEPRDGKRPKPPSRHTGAAALLLHGLGVLRVVEQFKVHLHIADPAINPLKSQMILLEHIGLAIQGPNGGHIAICHPNIFLAF